MKFLLVFSFALLAIINYTNAIDMARCAQLAIAKGIPEMKIPSHDPFVDPKNRTIHLNNLLGSNFTFKVSKITWSNIPWWKVKKDVVTKNTTEVLAVDGALWWDNFTFTYNYEFEWKTLKLNGIVQYLYKDVTWAGDWEETKPDSNGIRKINYLHIKQSYASRSIKTTGFGPQKVVAENFLLAMNDIVNEVLINDLNIYGKALAHKIDKVWYGNVTIYQKLVKWCEGHGVISEYNY